MTSSETARGAKGNYKEKQSQKKINHELPARHGKVDFGVDETPSFRADTHPEHFTTIEGRREGACCGATMYMVPRQSPHGEVLAFAQDH